MIRPRFVIAALAFVGMAAPGVAQVASLPASGPVIQRVGKDVRLDAPAKPFEALEETEKKEEQP